MSRYVVHLTYRDLRRRIERRLAQAVWLYGNIALFIAASLAFVMSGRSYFWAYDPYWSGIQTFFTGWSIILFVHAVWTYRRSGANEARRERMLETELRDRVRNPLYEVPSRQLFALHTLLNDHIRRRAGWLFVLLGTTAFNALMWSVWFLLSGRYDSTPWQVTLFFAFFFIPLYGFHAWRMARFERRLMPEVEEIWALADEEQWEKPKRLTTEATAYALGDDGELIADAYESELPKRKHHPG